MSPIDIAVVARKLAKIEERLDLLRPVGVLAPDAYRADTIRKKGAEKLLQELINAAIDLNFHLLVQSGEPAPKDSFASFADAARIGGYSAALAKRAAPFAGLRNRLVHEYETLDDSKVLAAIREAQEVFPAILKGVREKFLPKSGGA